MLVCGIVKVDPDYDQLVPISLPVNITLTCNVSEDSENSAGTEAIWEVDGRQILNDREDNPVSKAFEKIGVFIEQKAVGVATVIVSHEARLHYQESGMVVRCIAFTYGEPPTTVKGRAITIRTYGKS